MTLDDFELPFIKDLVWYYFSVQAKIQIYYNKFYSNFFCPFYSSFERFLNLDDDDEDDDDCIPPKKELADYLFISVRLYYDLGVPESPSIDINLQPDEYVVNSKLFTFSWLKQYIQKNNLDIQLELNNYNIQFIDHNISTVMIDPEKYIILNKNNYIIKTI